MSDLLFENLLVLDCASYIAGPAAATMLGDFGARVIKIEPPKTGDAYRQLIEMPGTPLSEQNYFWMLDNRNKEGLALDLKQPAARALLDRLIAKADVFVTNFPLPIREQLKLAAKDVMRHNERLIYASLTPYGEKGPEKDRKGFDATAWWARSGLMSAVRADASAEPVRSISGIGDHPTAVALFAAIVTALYRREISGKGGEVSTSLLANGLWTNGCYVQAALCGATFVPRPPRYERNPLLEAYRCRDGRWFTLSLVNHAREWPLLADCAGQPQLAADPRFASLSARQTHAGTLTRILEDIFRAEDLVTWQTRLIAAGVTFSPIAEPNDHLECPQVRANDMLPAFADAPELRTVANPVCLAGETKVAARMAPELGQHSLAILEELGISAAETAELRRAGAVGFAT